MNNFAFDDDSASDQTMEQGFFSYAAGGPAPYSCTLLTSQRLQSCVSSCSCKPRAPSPLQSQPSFATPG